jgi:hypothetical protein
MKRPNTYMSAKSWCEQKEKVADDGPITKKKIVRQSALLEKGIATFKNANTRTKLRAIMGQLGFGCTYISHIVLCRASNS